MGLIMFLKLNKEIIRLGLIFIVAILFLVVWLLRSDIFLKGTIIGQIENDSFESIQMQEGVAGNSVEYNDKNEIQIFINELQISEWILLNDWPYPAAPDYNVFMNNGNSCFLGFMFLDNEAFCKIEYKDSILYYRIPTETYSTIEAILTLNNGVETD